MSKGLLRTMMISVMLSVSSGQALATPTVYRFEGLVSGDEITPPDPSDRIQLPTRERLEDLRFSLLIEVDTEGVFDGKVAGFGTVYSNNGLQSFLTVCDVGSIDLGAAQAQAWQGVNRVRLFSDPLRAAFIGTCHRLVEDWGPTSVYLLADESFVSNNIQFPGGTHFVVTDCSDMKYSARIVP